jgi:hypothetical protein
MPTLAAINGLVQKWVRVTTKPGTASFAVELPNANWGDIWLGIMGLAVLTAITSYLSALEFGSLALHLSQLTPDQQRAFNQVLQFTRPGGGTALGAIIGVPLGFFISTGVLFWFAKLFGGTGTFLQHTYAFALFFVPLQGVSAILGLIPVLGGLVDLVLAVYSIVLAVFAISASHRLTSGTAVAVVVLPAVIALFLACTFFFALVAIIVAITHPS